MSFTYVDYGTHGMWVDAHQGYSWCQQNKLLRHFIGSDEIYPAVSGDLRLDSHVYVNTSSKIGDQLVGYDIGVLTATAYATVGIVEDEEAGVGRYFALKYTHDGSSYVVDSLVCYDSDYTDELASTTVYSVWEPVIPVAVRVEQGMRVVNFGRSTGTYLFYLVPGTYSTSVYVLNLPVPGNPATTTSPTLVTVLDFVADTRFYVVPRGEYDATLIVGSSDRSETYTSAYINYNLTNKTASAQKTFYAGYSPFPHSYAATPLVQGNGMVALMEPTSSREELANICDNTRLEPGLFQKTTGNSWNILVVTEEMVVTDDMPVTPFNFQPWFSGAFGDAAGGVRNIANTPMYLGNRTDSPVYTLACKAGVRGNDPAFTNEFVYRKDLISDLLPTHGLNRLTSNIRVEGISPTFGDAYRTQTSPTVAGTIFLETPSDISFAGTYGARLASTTSSRLDSWRYTDQTQMYGYPILEPSSATEPNASDYDYSTQDVNGVVADADNLSVTVVGWFYHGSP